MLDRSIAPIASSIVRPNLPIPVKLKVGEIPLVILDRASQPLILFEIVFPLGRKHEPKAGLAFLLFKMFQEGTSKYSAEEIAEILDFHGSFLEISPTLDNVSIKLYTLRRFFPKLINLLVELLTDSVFPQREFDTLQQIRREQVKQQHARSDAYANLKFREMLFGAEHPYGRVTTEAIIDSINRDDLVSFSKQALPVPTIFLTGRIKDEEIKTVQEAFRYLSLKPQHSDTAIISGDQRSKVIQREDSTQVSLRMGQFVVDRLDKNIHRFKIANELLGGFFGSRLMKNIREDKGLTYGIHSSLVHLRDASYWVIGSEILKGKTDLAISEIKKEIETLQNQPPSNGEFKMVINYMKGKFLSSFDSPFNTHEMIKGSVLACLPDDYFISFLSALDQMTPPEICEVLEAGINLESFTYLEVG